MQRPAAGDFQALLVVRARGGSGARPPVQDGGSAARRRGLRGRPGGAAPLSAAIDQAQLTSVGAPLRQAGGARRRRGQRRRRVLAPADLETHRGDRGWARDERARRVPDLLRGQRDGRALAELRAPRSRRSRRTPRPRPPGSGRRPHRRGRRPHHTAPSRRSRGSSAAAAGVRSRSRSTATAGRSRSARAARSSGMVAGSGASLPAAQLVSHPPGASARLAIGDCWRVVTGTVSSPRRPLPRAAGRRGLGARWGSSAPRRRSSRVGFQWYLELLGLISMSIALFNLLPLLPLDGGNILFAIIEGAARARGAAGGLPRFSSVRDGADRCSSP